MVITAGDKDVLRLMKSPLPLLHTESLSDLIPSCLTSQVELDTAPRGFKDVCTVRGERDGVEREG